jgi:hypothetical protein
MARDKKYNDFIYFYFIKLSTRAKCTAQTSASRASYIAGLRYACGLRINDFIDGSQRNSDILPEVDIVPCVGGACES